MPDNTTSQTTGHQPELLTITEAAELLRAPVATLRYWRHLNMGPHSFRLGRRVLYRRDDLTTWIAAQHERVHPRKAGGWDARIVPPGKSLADPAVQPADMRLARCHRSEAECRGDRPPTSEPPKETSWPALHVDQMAALGPGTATRPARSMPAISTARVTGSGGSTK